MTACLEVHHATPDNRHAALSMRDDPRRCSVRSFLDVRRRHIVESIRERGRLARRHRPTGGTIDPLIDPTYHEIHASRATSNTTFMGRSPRRWRTSFEARRRLHGRGASRDSDASWTLTASCGPMVAFSATRWSPRATLARRARRGAGQHHRRPRNIAAMEVPATSPAPATRRSGYSISCCSAHPREKRSCWTASRTADPHPQDVERAASSRACTRALLVFRQP